MWDEALKKFPLCLSFIILGQIRPTGNTLVCLESFRGDSEQDEFSAHPFVDDTVFAYWEHEVISTLLVSLLGSGPDNSDSHRGRPHVGSKASINCLFSLFPVL